MVREAAALLLKRAALALLAAAVRLNGRARAGPREEPLPDVPLPAGGGPRTAEAAGMVAARPAPDEGAADVPVAGSVEARIAKARGGW